MSMRGDEVGYNCLFVYHHRMITNPHRTAFARPKWTLSEMLGRFVEFPHLLAALGRELALPDNTLPGLFKGKVSDRCWSAAASGALGAQERVVGARIAQKVAVGTLQESADRAGIC